MAIQAQGTVHGGQIRLDEDAHLPDGARVIVTVVSESDVEEIRGITGQELLDSGLVGMWADREDITDSAAFARDLRERAQRRE